MLAISTNFVIGAFVALYASVASAIPVTDTTALLAPRLVPDKNMCGVMPWIRRECSTVKSPRTWVDICQNNDLSERRSTGDVLCAVGTYCENIVDSDKSGHWIMNTKCVPATKPGMTQPSKNPTDPLIGSSIRSQGIKGKSTTPASHSVTIPQDMEASVSAFFLSDDEKHVLQSPNVIVGKIRGKDITVCSGDSRTDLRALECFPAGRHQFHAGEIIDFSWGLSSGEAGSLKYLVWPKS